MDGRGRRGKLRLQALVKGTPTGRVDTLLAPGKRVKSVCAAKQQQQFMLSLLSGSRTLSNLLGSRCHFLEISQLCCQAVDFIGFYPCFSLGRKCASLFAILCALLLLTSLVLVHGMRRQVRRRYQAKQQLLILASCHECCAVEGAA